MHNQSVLQPGGMPRRYGIATLRDALLLKLCAWATRSVCDGRLRLTLPSGQTALLGRGGTGRVAELQFGSFRVFWSSLRRGTLGFAECYLDGDVATPDLAQTFRFFIDNKLSLNRAGRGFFRVRARDRQFHSANRNTRAGSRRNIAAHYDLGNAFYALWLDPGMTYSSACFETPDQPLADAQHTKITRVLDALEVRPGTRLLEIGCGWGSLAEAAGRRGAKVTAITVSNEQLAHARERIASAGLADRVSVRFEDYRDTAGQFDRIASVEMIEAVGEDHWSDYFRTLHDRLAPGGLAVIQAITIREPSWDAYARKTDFIQRYIFPGGMLPTKSHLASHAASAGLEFDTLATFATDYARTLALWRQNVQSARARIEGLGFDERFLRMWDYYLTYCEVGFERGVIDVGHYRFRRPATSGA